MMARHASYKIRADRLLDLVVVSCCIPVGIFFAIFIHADLTVFVILFYGLPTVYLFLRKEKNYRKIFFASLVLGVLFGMAYDIVAEFHDAYFTTYHYSLLAHVFVGNTPVGDVLWAFLIPLYTITFYEHFIDDEKIVALSKYARAAFIFGIVLLIISWTVVKFYPTFPRIPYAYAVLGALTAVPLLGLVRMRSRSIKKILFVTIFFFFFNLFGETAELYLQLGGYHGQYIAWVPLVVARMPIEEFLYWTILSAPSFIFCYEWLFDDFA